MSRVVALIQARMGSTRFPGKMLANLGGYSILEWVVQRVSHAQLIDKVVLATTDLPRDNPLVALAYQLGIEVFRGSEADVLGRFAAAAAKHEADLVVRICADNPFVDADEIDRLVTYFKSTSCDYACNHQERLGNCYADGFGAEILANSLLQRISQVATEYKHREHATSYIWDNASEFHIEAVPAPRELAYPELRFDVDMQQDLERLKKMVTAGIVVATKAPEIVQIALSCEKPVLVTTDISKNLINSDHSYFLGAWCFKSRHEEQEAREQGLILPYHWDDRDKLKQDFERLQRLNNNLVEELTPILNNIHGTKEDSSHWRLLLGYWLNIYTAVVFDRWSSLCIALKKEKFWRAAGLLLSEQDLALNDTEDFIKKSTECSKWNDALFSLLIDYIPEIELVCFRSDRSELKPAIPKNELGFFKKSAKKIINTLGAYLKSRDQFYLVSTYLGVKDLVRLEIALNQFPLPRFGLESNAVASFDYNFRQWRCLVEQNDDQFEVIVRDLLPKFLPKIFLEGYSDLIRMVDEFPWPKFPKVIFTSNAHFTNDIFKAWAAKKISKGTRLVIGEHGGLGVGLFNGAHNYELSIADTYFSTGWTDVKKKKIVPIGNFRMAGREVSPNPNGRALMVGVNMPRFSFDVRSMALSSQILEYHEDQFEFLKLLPFHLQSQILIRLYPSDYGWQVRERWIDRHPSVVFDQYGSSIIKTMENCRLFIGTYAATTYVDSLALNFPTVIFWNPRYWEVKEDAKPHFKRLKDAGIFHECPKTAADHISRVWNNVPSWWHSQPVQSARQSFCDAYSSDSTDIVRVLKDALFKERKLSKVSESY